MIKWNFTLGLFRVLEIVLDLYHDLKYSKKAHAKQQ